MTTDIEADEGGDDYAFAEAIPQLFFASGPDGRPVYFNRRWYDYTGFVRRDVLDPAEDWIAPLHPEDVGRCRDAWRDSLRRGAALEVECRIRSVDGGHRWFVGRAVPLLNAAGAVSRWFGTCTDVDALLERLVAERTAELKRSNDDLETFALIASHDLQEPLRKVQAFGDRLAARCGPVLDDQGRDYLNRIVAAAERMRNLINDLLAFSRMAGPARPFTAVDLGAVASAVVSDLAIAIERSGGRVEVGPLPTIQADPTQMRRLLQNLIGNAIKFHGPGRPPTVRVSARIGPEPDRCELEVADDGIGFDEAYLDRIFQVFQRLHGRNEYEGTGMGLAICRKIVERHSGRITATSEPGVGSTFRVALPVRGGCDAPV